MNFSKVFSAQATIAKATIISVEVDISRGLHAFAIVGLPDKAVEESRDRIAAAIKNSGFTSPKSKNQKVVISLAPADIKKEGPSFDVPMALAYLLASDEIYFSTDKKLFLGELSLNGELRSIPGVLSLAREAYIQGFNEIYVPKANAREAALIEGIKVYGVQTLRQLIDHINTKQENRISITPEPITKINPKSHIPEIDFADVHGQEGAKRALEIAAAGGHNIAMYGPPGTGKTMLAKAFSHILPRLSFEEMLEVSSIYSIAGNLAQDMMYDPPFRSPHHTASYISIVGGGSFPKPGEITLAHRGVLFMDEFPEFDREVIDALRQPLEDRVVTISRAKGTTTFPASVILVVAMNPCPCGNYGVTGKNCSCSSIALLRYQQRISGPIVDRIDLWTEVSIIDHSKLSEKAQNEPTSVIKKRVEEARRIQQIRFKDHERSITTNNELIARDIPDYIMFTDEAKKVLTASAERMNLSGRAHHRLMKIARTIADLQAKEIVDTESVLEALQYRPKRIQ